MVWRHKPQHIVLSASAAAGCPSSLTAWVPTLCSAQALLGSSIRRAALDVGLLLAGEDVGAARVVLCHKARVPIVVCSRPHWHHQPPAAAAEHARGLQGGQIQQSAASVRREGPLLGRATLVCAQRTGPNACALFRQAPAQAHCGCSTPTNTSPCHGSASRRTHGRKMPAPALLIWLGV